MSILQQWQPNNENPYASLQYDRSGNTPDGLATIRLTRTTYFPDTLRAYRIMVDGMEMARVKGGESVEIPVSPGTHSVVVKIDWCGSPTLDFTVRTGETIEFECESNLRGLRIFWVHFYILFMRDRYLALTRV